MIREALEFLVGLKRPESVEVAQREFVLAGAYAEVQAPRSPDKKHALGSVAALCAYLKDHALWDPSLAAVLVSPKGIVAFLDEEATLRRDVVTVPFFNDDLPPAHPLSYEELLLYLDQHEGRVVGLGRNGEEIAEAELRALLKLVTVRKDEALTLADRGAFIEVTATASRGVKAGAEAQAVQIPAKLRFELRRGTREYEIPHVFRLYGQLSEKGAPMFRLVHLDRDDAVDAWMRRCLTDVRETLGSQWRVYQGA